MSRDLLNRLAPDFSLSVLGGGRFNLADLRGHIVVLNFWSAECPWSRRADVLLVYRYPQWEPRGVRLIGIASNFNEPEGELRFEAEKRRVTYPILLDPDQKIADLYQAVVTPQFFILDRQRSVRYTGALDDANAEQRRARTLYVEKAVQALLSDKLPEPATTTPFGCMLARLRASSSGTAVQTVEDSNR